MLDFMNNAMAWQMGSPLGPTLAHVFVCQFENIWLENCPPHFKPIV